MSLVDEINQLWTQALGLIAKVVSPDWGSLVGLLPLFLLVGVIGPLVTILALLWMYYFVRRPRTRVRFVEGPRLAAIAGDGLPLFPPGEPYDVRTGLIDPPGTTQNDAGELLSVICPMCGVGRSADVTTCGNCGLVLKVEAAQVARSPLQPAGPPARWRRRRLSAGRRPRVRVDRVRPTQEKAPWRWFTDPLHVGRHHDRPGVRGPRRPRRPARPRPPPRGGLIARPPARPSPARDRRFVEGRDASQSAGIEPRSAPLRSRSA